MRKALRPMHWAPRATPMRKRLTCMHPPAPHANDAGVLYTSDPADLTAADIVLVITASGEDAASYVQHARAGQVRGHGSGMGAAASGAGYGRASRYRRRRLRYGWLAGAGS